MGQAQAMPYYGTIQGGVIAPKGRSLQALGLAVLDL
jgi:hypothetical protein